MSRVTVATTLAIALAAMSGSARADNPAAASAAFQQAEALAKQDKWADACPLYEASYHADAQLGVLLHLADCYEHVGRLATAAAEFNDAAELAHRKNDNREAYAQGRADALKPKLAHLRLTPPPSPPPNLVVRRDGTDITVLVGTDMPIDPGEHEVTANAPGRIEWRRKLVIGVLATTTPLGIPDLELAPVTAADPIDKPKLEPRDGTLHITAHPVTATILLDGTAAGIGHADKVLRSGGHTLRVVADGMHAYQTEVQVGDGEERSIDVPLEKEITIVTTGPTEPDGPSFELGGSISPGIKFHTDRPVVIAYRIELAKRLGRRNNFGLVLEAGSVDPNSGRGACGTDLPGAKAGSPFDFGPRDRFASCNYIMPGLQLLTHILPGRRFDPYIGVAAGFRLSFMKWTPYDATGGMQTAISDTWPAVIAELRTGLDYHPTPRFQGWQVGVAVSLQGAVAQETQHGNSSGGPVPYASVFAGLRSTIQF